ncbi:MAG: RNA polymerase sigma factor [Pirellulales bacterium]|nr:RNA polymerase sigma factor [Pirellulales bacterium]
MSDEIRNLVSRVLDGDHSAVQCLIERFQGQVFGLCYRMLGNRQDAEDAAQESFLRMYRSIARWDSTRDFRPWLLAIAGNRCRTMLSARKKAMQNVAIIEECLEDETPAAEHADNLQEEVNLALSGMRAEYRQAFQLFHEQELSYAEISEALQCPLGTVKTWVHRARREIAAQLCRREVIVEKEIGAKSAREGRSKQRCQETESNGSSKNNSIFGLPLGVS